MRVLKDAMVEDSEMICCVSGNYRPINSVPEPDPEPPVEEGEAIE